MKTTVVYVHGLWMTGWEGFVLRNRLAVSLRANTPRFSYASVTSNLTDNARSLAAMLKDQKTDQLHLVGHSLGGLVIHKLFEVTDMQSLPPGRVVLMGSPAAGSRAARRICAWSAVRPVVGRSIAEAFTDSASRAWRSSRELGVIAGNRSVGLGRLVVYESGASDGTVFVDETPVVGMKERVVMKVSHTAMPFSKDVAETVTRFLSTGSFAG